jgi:hypothetical protein
MNRGLRILAIVVVTLFVMLVIFEFTNILGLLRSRVAIVLLLGPLVALFLWATYRTIVPKKTGPSNIDVRRQ